MVSGFYLCEKISDDLTLAGSSQVDIFETEQVTEEAAAAKVS